MLNSINLIQELRALLPEIGSWYLIRSWDSSQKCSCRRLRANDEPDPTCVICDGRGFPYTERPARMYSYNQALNTGFNTAEFQGTLFRLSEEGFVFFADPAERISISDEIFEVRLNDDQSIDPNLDRLGRFIVNTVDDLRADRRGEPALLMVYTSESEVMRHG